MPPVSSAARSRPTCAAAWLRRGSRKSSAESTCFQAAGSSSPDGVCSHAHSASRSSPVITAWRIQPSSASRSRSTPGRVGVRQQRARVELRRLLDRAAQQQRADAPEVGLHVAAEPVGVGLDREPDQLAQPRDLAADGAVARVVAVDLRAELLGRQAVRAQAQQREDLGLAAAERDRAAVDDHARAIVAEQAQLRGAAGAARRARARAGARGTRRRGRAPPRTPGRPTAA